MITHLLALDPGGTTGYAFFSRQPDGRYRLEEAGDFPLWKELPQVLDWVVRESRASDTLEIDPDAEGIVVFEQIQASHPAFDSIGIQVIGVLRFLCEQERIRNVAQHPALITGIKKWGILNFVTIKSEHARDAVRHGVMYLGVSNVDLTQGT
jgi:hypothetical protein